MAENPGVTRIEREHFLLHAPFQWKAVPGDDPLQYEFVNQTLREQLVATVMLPRETIQPEMFRKLAEELATGRWRALATLSKGRAILSPLQFQEASGQCEVRGFARDDAEKVRIAFVIRVAPAKVVTVALTRYFLDEVGNPFEVGAGLMFDLLQVKNPGAAANG
jgi:hypothetical protein